MLFKLLLLAAIVAGVYYLFIKPKPTLKRPDKRGEEEELVECAKCKTFVSSKEAIIKDGKYYCSKECAGAK